MWTRILADPEFDLEGMLVAESDGRVVGYSHFGSSEEDETQGEVFGFYAHPRVWGTGVSSELMRATLAELRIRARRPATIRTHVGADRARLLPKNQALRRPVAGGSAQSIPGR